MALYEIERILKTADGIDFSKQKAALATVVQLYGSGYRRPGARMLVCDDGRWVGAISGGCLEGDALRKARKAMLDQKPMLITYDTLSDEGSSSLGVGLGCNGVIDVLIEPIQEEEKPLEWLKQMIELPEKLWMAMVFKHSENSRLNIGGKILFEGNTILNNNLQDKSLTHFLQQEIVHHPSYISENSFNLTIEKDGETADLWVEFLQPKPNLWIFGAGYDAVPMVELSKKIGWQVKITDDCAAHLIPVRFDQADEMVCCGRETVVEAALKDKMDFAVLMSHNFKYDFEVLKNLLKTNVQYIGILGPKKRYERMKEELLKEGISLTQEDEERIFSPIGLDLGAETPEEIAFSIIAEIQAHRKKMKAGFLKFKKGFIHT